MGRLTYGVLADPGAAAAGKDSESENDGSRRVVQLFRRPFLSDEAAATLCRKANAKDAVNGAIASVVTEQCFNVEVTSPLTSDEMATLQWLLRETFEPDLFTEATQLDGDVVEVGPRLAFQSAWSTNAVSICQNTGLGKVTRLERSRRYSLVPAAGKSIDDSAKLAFASLVHDRMTECVYDSPLRRSRPMPSRRRFTPFRSSPRVGRRSRRWTRRWDSPLTRRTSTTT